MLRLLEAYLAGPPHEERTPKQSRQQQLRRPDRAVTEASQVSDSR